MKTKKKEWGSVTPRNCEICHEPLTNKFIDGATIRQLNVLLLHLFGIEFEEKEDDMPF